MTAMTSDACHDDIVSTCTL